jgi:hypothetical protein
LADFAKIYFADIFEFGAVQEEVLLGLYSSPSNLWLSRSSLASHVFLCRPVSMARL